MRSLNSLEKQIRLCLHKHKPGEKKHLFERGDVQNMTLYAILHFHAALLFLTSIFGLCCKCKSHEPYRLAQNS